MDNTGDDGYRRLAVAMVADAVKLLRGECPIRRAHAAAFLRSSGCAEILENLDLDPVVVLERLELSSG